MKLFYAVFFVVFLFMSPSSFLRAETPGVLLRKGMVINKSIVVKKGVYSFGGSKDTTSGIINIKGDNIVIDFNGSVLDGSSNKTRPDNFVGIGVYIKGGKRITIKNAIIKGFKIALFARGSEQLTIEDCDMSFNFRQRLNSNRLWEDLSDWQSYHDNEKDQWLRFGAGMYLKDCDNATIKNNTIMQGQCALMLTKSNRGMIYNNNFSFNSGVGIGLYRSSYNRVMNNKLDWNVRGVSYGYYYRGQDAAGILVYEQSSHNVFAYNSATHSGDGIFLWAGKSTLESGKGGCNDNLIYGNDFSFAPTNGVEVTFSRNKVINNIIEGCDYGVWAGYSYQTLMQGNIIKGNNTGIAIEQGQDNVFSGNDISDGKTGVRLWATPGRPKEGKYDIKKDVRSMRYKIEGNSFNNLQTALVFAYTDNIRVEKNKVNDVKEWIRTDTSVKHLYLSNNMKNTIFNLPLFESSLLRQPDDARSAMLPHGHARGKEYIMMTSWGPFDFRSPIFWWENTDSLGRMHFRIYGPKGKWVLRKDLGVKNISESKGTVPGYISFERNGDQLVDVLLEYEGEQVVSQMGRKYDKGASFIFGYKKLFLDSDWKVSVFSFNKQNDPLRNIDAFRKLINTTTPVQQIVLPKLNNSFGGNKDRIALTKYSAIVAHKNIDVPKGKYIISVSASEMVRVFVDGKMVIDAWDPSRIKYDADYHHEALVNMEGRHTIRIEQAQYGEYGMLYSTIVPEGELRID